MKDYKDYVVETRDVYETKIQFRPVSGIVSFCSATAGGVILNLCCNVSLIPAIGMSCLAAATAFFFTGWRRINTNKVIGKEVKIRLNDMTLGEYGNLAEESFIKTSSLIFNEETKEFFVWGYFSQE